MAKFIIQYNGILAPMYVTGFSEPLDVGTGDLERSVKASSLFVDAMVFTSEAVDEALKLTRRCHPNAGKIPVED